MSAQLTELRRRRTNAAMATTFYREWHEVSCLWVVHATALGRTGTGVAATMVAAEEAARLALLRGFAVACRCCGGTTWERHRPWPGLGTLAECQECGNSQLVEEAAEPEPGGKRA